LEEVDIMGAVGVESMARKKAESPKGKGTLIRVSDEFAAAVGEVARFENLSNADWLDALVLPLARKLYREAVIKKAKRMEGGDK
jgi:hypothetical protein